MDTRSVEINKNVTVLQHAVATIISPFKQLTKANKILEARIPAGFTAVSCDIKGSIDGALWEILQTFTASGSYINNDGYELVRADITVTTGSGVATANAVVTAKTDDTAVGDLTGDAWGPYRQEGGLLYSIATVNTYAIGEYVKITDDDTLSDWDSAYLPVVAVDGSSEIVVWDRHGLLTATNGSLVGTVDSIDSVITLLVGE